jgi:hypothetical protein
VVQLFPAPVCTYRIVGRINDDEALADSIAPECVASPTSQIAALFHHSLIVSVDDDKFADKPGSVMTKPAA